MTKRKAGSSASLSNERASWRPRVAIGADPNGPASGGGNTMRKLLLASAAMLGATSGIASAQTPSMAFQPSQGMMVGPSAPNSIANTSNNVNGQPSTFDGYSKTFYGAIPAPQPGTVVIRLNGKVEVDLDAFWTSSNNSVTTGGGFSGYKLNPIAFGAYMRLYPAVDGMATNGLR